MDIEHLQVKVTQKAIIRVEDKVLLVLEGEDWELPGGRVDKDETNLKEALKRELREELSIEATPSNIFATYLFTKPDGEVALAIIYECELISSIESISIRPGEIDDWKLFTIEELKKLNNIYPNSQEAVTLLQ